MFGDRVERAGRPRAVAMPAQVNRVNMEIVAQRPRHPVPIPRVIQTAVNQDHRGLAFSPPVPELQLQTVRVEEMRNGFQRIGHRGETTTSLRHIMRVWFWAACAAVSGFCLMRVVCSLICLFMLFTFSTRAEVSLYESLASRSCSRARE